MKASPLLIVFAGPNGGGKSTLRDLLLADSTIPFINADRIALERGIGAYEAAGIAEEMRRGLVEARVSFMFETVLSDPVGAKVSFLRDARAAGYRVIVHFVALATVGHSLARVFQRVTEGGHDVPERKVRERFPRVLANLARLIGTMDELVLYDNSSAAEPYRLVARMEGDRLVALSATIPDSLAFLALPALATPQTVLLP